MESDRSVEEMQYVHNVVKRAHLTTLASGHYFVLWGSLISLGMIYAWLETKTSLPVSPAIAWAVLISIGWAVTFFITARERRRSTTTSSSGRTLALVWMGCGVSMTVALLGGTAFGAIPGTAVPGLTATFLALGMLATGLLVGLRWLTYVAALWWLSALALFLAAPEIAVLGLAGCLLALLVAPGWVLHVGARARS
jgi:hypothetical protein